MKNRIEIPCSYAEDLTWLYRDVTSIPSLILITVFLFFFILSIRAVREKGWGYLIEDGTVSFHLPSFIFSLYLVILFKITVLPGVSWFSADATRAENTFVINLGLGLSSFNIIPFKSIIAVFRHGILYGLYNNLGNLLLLSPFGFLSPMVHKSQSGKKTVLLGAIIALIIEFLQFFEMRSSDIDDLILNVIGVTIGYYVFYVINRSICKGRSKKVS